MKCSYCNSDLNKATSEVNRAKKNGLNLYCNRTCSKLGRRINKTEEQNKKEKREYDKKYREKNKERIAKNKSEYNKTEAGRATQKRTREKRKRQHLEYCRTPEYKEYKKKYDQIYLSKKNYGEFWECSILLNEIRSNIPNKEIKQQQELINKSQKRKRNYEKAKR